MAGPRLVAGLDIGSTGVKVLIAHEDGADVLVEQVPTPWRHGESGTTTLATGDLTGAVEHLLHTVDAAFGARAELRGARVGALAISGMGETGFLLDGIGQPVAPGFAWFDPRGATEIDLLPEAIRRDFPGRTGLPLGAQVSVAKLLHVRAAGQDLRGLRWFNVPEFLGFALGARPVSEYSLVSRTGLIDQGTGRAWPELLDCLGVDESFLPPLVDAGVLLGHVSAAWVPKSFTGARLTVAGHDHLVSAVAAGPSSPNRYHVSMGTAEVLLRVLDEPPSDHARARLADNLINTVRHVIPGKHVLVAGVKSGLLMRRTLQLCGIRDAQGRTQLDAEVMRLPTIGRLADGAITVRGARNDDGALSVVIRSDDVSPAELFIAVLRHGNDEIRRLTQAMDREVPPATSSLLTGGWSAMACVQRARAEVLPALEVSPRSQDTARGAALSAIRLLEDPRAPGLPTATF